MQPAYRLISAVVLAAASISSFGATTIYTTSAAFLPNVKPGAYTESFTGLANPAAGPFSFVGGAFSYTAFAPSSLYLAAGFLGTSQIDEALTITFNSGNVTALGANFYATDLDDAFQSVALTLKLSDGTTTTFTPTSVLNSYRGFVSTIAITSLVISGPGPALYAGMDNFTVGIAVVPEPASGLLLALGVAGLLVAHRRRPV